MMVDEMIKEDNSRGVFKTPWWPAFSPAASTAATILSTLWGGGDCQEPG